MDSTPTLIQPRPGAADVASEVVRAALEVQRTLGPGLDADIYQRALELELDHRRVRYWRDVFVDLTYKGRRVGRSRVPLVAGGVLIGIRVAPLLSDGDAALLAAQARSLGVGGLLLNFGGERLEIRRVRPPRGDHGRDRAGD